MIKINFLMCIAVHFFATALSAKNAEEVVTHRSTLKELPRINGEIDFSKIEEIALKTAEKTQFAGRFGIVVAHIEDLVQAPEFIGFRPVIVIGKLTYRRESKSYVCHIQWEKVCLVTPAFNKVKRLDKGLSSRLNYSGNEISKDFLMNAKGDIATFIKNVKELFNAPVATESDLTDKEREKLNSLANNNLKSKSAMDAGGSKSGDKSTMLQSSKDSDPKKTSEHQSAHGSQKKNEGDTLLPSQPHKTNESKKSGGAEESSPESKSLKETEKTKKSNAVVVGGEGVDATRGDGVVPRISDPGSRDSRNLQSNSDGTSRGDSSTESGSSNNTLGGSTPGASSGEQAGTRNGTSRNSESNRGGTSRGDSGTESGSSNNASGRAVPGRGGVEQAGARNGNNRNPESNSAGTSRGDSGTESGSSNNALGGSASGASGEDSVNRTGNANETLHTRNNASNESNRENRTVVNVHNVDGSNGRSTSSGQTQDDMRHAYQYGYDHSVGNNGEQDGSSVTPLSVVTRETTGSGASAPLAETTPVATAGSGDYMGSTTVGCIVRVDLNQLRAFQQEKLIVRRNGREEISECKDGNTTYTIHKDYNHPYEVDLAANKAYPTYSYYYIDGTGRRKDVHIAGRINEKDINNPVVLQETEEGCDVKEEYGRDSTTIVKCKRKTYIKHSGEKEFATACLETNIKSRVVITNEGCPVSHDLSAKRSFIQQRRVYQFPGDSTPTQYSRCEPENRHPIPHETKPCEPEVENGKCFERKRVEVKVNGQNIVISPCARVSVNGTPLEKEFENSYSHLSDKSHPYMRKYYTFNNQKYYVTGSEVDLSTVFSHSKRILTYENKDELKKAIPLEKTYFKGVHGHDVDVVIEPGAPIDYEKTRETEIRFEGEPTYDGCYKVTKKAVYLKYKRPNTTFYYEKQKDEEPLREYVCQTDYIVDDDTTQTIINYVMDRGSVTVSQGVWSGDANIDRLVPQLDILPGFKSEQEIREIIDKKRSFVFPVFHNSFAPNLGITTQDQVYRLPVKNIIITYKMLEKRHAITKLNGKEINRSSHPISTRSYDRTVTMEDLNAN